MAQEGSQAVLSSYVNGDDQGRACFLVAKFLELFAFGGNFANYPSLQLFG